MKIKMKKSVIYRILLILLSASVTTACVDTLKDDLSPNNNNHDGVGFYMSVAEQADMKINLGTRSMYSVAETDSGRSQDVTSPSSVRLMEGDNPYVLKMHCMTLPYVGIHNGAVRTSATQPQSSEQSGGETTRAAWADHVSSAETFHDSLTVWGYTRDAATSIFDKTLVQRITNWRTSRHWPFGETGPMRFYAVAPSLESINMSVVDADYSTPPVLTYTLPEKAQDMCDLLYGESGDIDIPSFGTEDSHEGKDDKIVNLQFQHILTAIRFAQGNIPTGITIKQISINNVNTRATFVPSANDNMTDSKGTWSGFETPGNYTMNASFAGTGITNTYINDSVFYMLPQIVPSGVELEVVIESKPKYTYSSSGTALAPVDVAVQQHTLRCSLAGDVWRKGYTVTYLLTIGEVADGYYFVAEAPAENAHSDVVATHNFTLHSYRMYVDKETGLDITTHGVNWKVMGYYQNADCTTPFDGSNAANSPSWLTNGITGISSGVTGEYVGGNNGTASYNLAAQAATKSGNHATNLLSNSNDSQADKLDLSVMTPNGESKSAETANCYIINRTGSYKFPLVYGNKTSDGDEANYFVDHTGTVISHKFIRDQMTAKNTDPYHNTDYAEGLSQTEENATARYRKAYTWEGADNVSLRAVVVWQDVENMITSVSAAGSTNEITFTVGPSTPGNAVIALQAKSLTKYERRTYTPGSPGTFGDWMTDTSKGTDGYSTGEPWETLWTWHIWMTDEVYPNWSSTSEGATNVNTQYLNNNSAVGSGSYVGDHKVAFKTWGTDGSNGTTNTILPVNLGWVPQETEFKYYSKRDVYVKLQQVEPATGAATTVIHIVQHAKQPNVRGQGTFYQWGRPTALPGYNFTDDPGKTKRTIYFPNPDIFSESDFTVANITSPCEAIAQPTKLFRQESQAATWSSARVGGNSVPYWGETKTVYDPCPPGFKVPHWNIFTGLSLTGATANEGTNLNMWGVSAENQSGANFYGGYFFVDSHTTRESMDRYAQTVYFPATGQYQATKGVGSSLWTTTSPNNNFIEASPGTLWSNQLPASDNTHGSALNLYPDITRSNSSKPPVELPRAVNLSTACAIRPIEITP